VGKEIPIGYQAHRLPFDVLETEDCFDSSKCFVLCFLSYTHSRAPFTLLFSSQRSLAPIVFSSTKEPLPAMSDTTSARHRKPNGVPKEPDVPLEDQTGKSSAQSSSITLLDILRLLTGLALLSVALSYFITGDSLLWGYKPWFLSIPQLKSYVQGPISLTDAELLSYNGEDPNKPIYLGFNGSIYDVSAAPSTYGPGGSYHFFAGRDAVRAYLTGCFQEDLVPDLRGVEEMYVPREDPEDEYVTNDKGEKRKLSKTELKVRRERDWRIARKKVQEGVEGWANVFKGETGRPYFWVGTIKRDKDWLEKMPKRELCKPARDGRPTRDVAEKINPYVR
jgi:predicted heme/steroid binding protein